MGRKSRQQAVPFCVPDAKTVLQLCTNRIKPVLNVKELEFIELQKDSKRYIYELTNNKSGIVFATDDRGNKHRVIRLLPEILNYIYWINISLTFLPVFNNPKLKVKPDSFQFSGVSIRVFKGFITDDKEPLFRAEWDVLKDDNNHAQPHWHIDKSFLIRNFNTSEKLSFESLLKSNEVQDFGASIEPNNFADDNADLKEQRDWDNSTKFHFAMASQWHEKGGKHRFDIDKDSLFCWLEGCIQYIKEQLQYVSGVR
ncbi:hypothetical protein VB711_08350 [Cronbergia sp. UHCC 0137]|uniref:hypothetical protein n=1 Tax=Cronbergia sp. UHCC 0137 TaxID=3110239 RepID=UPI002B1E90CA|nr:hypothetical protein [Cronbergia sp. UHCC 0137]MEA5617848.1 hypothetical protein [Cronbergia sp. UHCC 0137]